VLFVLIGGIFLVCGLRTMNENLHIVQTGLRTTGVIVANERDSTGRHPVFYPVVRFVLRGPVPERAQVPVFGHFVLDRTGHFIPIDRAHGGVDGREVGDEVRGQTYEVRGTVGANPPAFRVGQTVTVYYDPQHPQTALIDTGKDLWLFPLVAIVMGTMFGLAGAWPLLRLLLRRTHTQTRRTNIRPRRNAPARRH
jgi:hypothetical protein